MYYPTATLQIGMPSLLDLRATMLAGISLSHGYGVDGNEFRGIHKPTGNSVGTNGANGAKNPVTRDCHNFQPNRSRFSGLFPEFRSAISELINSLSSINWSSGERPQTKQGRGYSRSRSIVSR